MNQVNRTNSKHTRPWGVTLLALGVLTNASLNSARLAQAIVQWQFISTLQGNSPLYLAVSGLVWAAAGWPLVFGLWRGIAWACSGARVFTVVFLIYFWFDRLFFSGTKGFSWPVNGYFLVLVSIFILLFVFWSTTNVKAKSFFGEINERTS